LDEIGAILAEKIDGDYWMYWLGTAEDKTDQMGLSRSKDLIHWTEVTQTPVLPRRPGKFDSRVVEPGPPPFLTNAGIVLIYNVRMTIWSIGQELRFSTAAIPRSCFSRDAIPVF